MKKFVIRGFVILSILLSIVVVNFKSTKNNNFSQIEEIPKTIESKDEQLVTEVYKLSKNESASEVVDTNDEVVSAIETPSLNQGLIATTDISSKDQIISEEVKSVKEELTTDQTNFQEKQIIENNELEKIAENSSYKKEQEILKEEFYKDFPVTTSVENVQLKNIDVEIKDNGGVVVEVQLTLGDKVNKEVYNAYAEEITDILKEKVIEIIGEDFFLKEIGIEASGILSKITEDEKTINQSFNDKKIYHYN